MATSGTIAQNSFNVAQLIEHAFRRIGKVASTITQEHTEIARDNLALILSSMINRGMNLWTFEKELIALSTNSIVYDMPVGTIELLNTQYRSNTLTSPTWTTTATSWVGEFTSSTTVTSFSVTPTTTQTLALEIATSSDGVTWDILMLIDSTSYTALRRVWFDVEPTATAAFWRIRETVAVSLALDDVTIVTQSVERVLPRINRDDYNALPNKRASGIPTQFWFDRQLTPRMWVWSMPSVDTDCIVVIRQREVQDVGELTNNLEIPSRWSESIIWELALRLCFEIPEVAPERISMVTQMAGKFDMEAGSEEYDKSSTYLAPNIAGYNA